MNKPLSTQPYKGVRDFYPAEMAVQRYLFDVWSRTAESFGFECYDASVLEPAELYQAKGAENAEMVNDQTYTFTDRGDREVTLRPEMTPSVARMIAGKRRELAFPVRWYSIPNLFRYERTQRGRLREHWQLNCDIFGTDDYTADVEVIALAHQIFLNFGADESMFEIRINDRQEMKAFYDSIGISDTATQTILTRLNDRKHKISAADYRAGVLESTNDDAVAESVIAFVESTESGDNAVIAGLRELGITNARIDRSIARGFDYYTSTIFEIVDNDPENNRSMMGGGRYDNLTGLFGGEPIPGIGFGFGDVTLKQFLETHDLPTANPPTPTILIIPTERKYNLEGQKIAQQFRNREISVATDISDKKIGKKIAHAGERLIGYALVVGAEEVKTKNYTVKNLTDGTEQSGMLTELLEKVRS